MTKRWDAVTVGEIYVDHVFSGLTHWAEPGEEIFTRNYLRELGGGAAITACGLGRLGRRTAVFGVVGAGEQEWIERRLGEFGVDAEMLTSAAGASGVTVSLSVGGERSFYSHAGTNELLTSYLERPEVRGLLGEARHVHFALPLDRGIAEGLLPWLKAAGTTSSLDVGWQPAWYGRAENLQTCREVDYFLPNEREARLLTGAEEPESMMARLAAMGLERTVIKLGARGALAMVERRMVWAPCRAVQVVDTTGAGDAFDAGLIDGIVDGSAQDEMMERAAACGSLSTRNAGALEGLATRGEMESR